MSRLKEVLERRLFRDNGMLGPENPQGILNSSPELADVVRMRDGGMTMASGPEAFSKFFRDTQFPVPGLPSEFLMIGLLTGKLTPIWVLPQTCLRQQEIALI